MKKIVLNYYNKEAERSLLIRSMNTNFFGYAHKALILKKM